MVPYGETRSGQGYKARYGNSILLENSSKPRTPRFPGRTASVVFERRVNAELSSQVFDENLSSRRYLSFYIYIYIGVTRRLLRDEVWKKIFRRMFRNNTKKKKKVIE